MKLLLIESWNEGLWVGIRKNNERIGEINNNWKVNDWVEVMGEMEGLFEESGIWKDDLDGIVVGEGGGWYSGLRIGVSSGKRVG